MGLVDLSTTRFIELSRSAAKLLGTTPKRGSGLTYVPVTEPPRQVEETARLMREGMFDGLRAHCQFRRCDGSMVEAELSGWAIRSRAGPDLGLWAAREVLSESSRHTFAEEVVTAPPWSHAGPKLDGARVTLDARWRITHISSSAALLLGHSLAKSGGGSIIELTHPEDLAVLLFAVARATTEASVGVWVRLRHRDGGWRVVHAAPTVLCGDGTSPFALVLAADPNPEAPDPSGEVSSLAGYLRRMAAQIEAAGVPVDAAVPLGVLATGLSARQWEVVSRLVRGEGVATIAAGLYISQSTVRNHLSAIFRKVGLHSQQEFRELWLQDARRLLAFPAKEPEQ
jgi:DNA-binding CsgD family transcriptional regulator